jgi:predicted glycosyltransferase
MKIWFDLSNSPHINLFAVMIRELQQQQHEIVITCRPLANTIDLLELHGLPHTVVGRHYGKKLSAKVFGYPVRVLELRAFLAPQKIDVAISQSSFHSPVVARLLGVPSIYMNDNEHAMGNVPSFLAATQIMVPEFLSIEALRKQWANPKRVQRYPGVKEGIYLWELDERLRLQKLPRAPKARKTIYVRPEPWTAQYYQGASQFLDDLLIGLSEGAEVVLLPRGKEQGKHYRAERFGRIRVIDTALDIAEIAPDCDLFIGAGGTMTREMAVLGIPTISVYQDSLLDVDRYLIEQGAYIHKPELTAREALDYLATMTRGEPNRELLLKGREAYNLIRDQLTSGRLH